MVRILYGVCGEGLGHTSRSRILIQYLVRHGHEVEIVAGGKAYHVLSQEFEHVHEIESGHFKYKNNEARLLHTVLWTIQRTLLYTPKSLFVVSKIIKQFQPEVIVSDADPVSNFIGSLYGLRRISIDNPHALLYRKYEVKNGEFASWFLLYIALRFSMRGADQYIIYDFSEKQIENKKVLFLKPLIQEGILRQTPEYHEHFFVYQTTGSDERLPSILKELGIPSIIYGYNKDSVDDGVVLKRFNEQDFYRDIATAKAVITNGGFTVISEALFLKKPVLSFPIKNQFEQVLNGRFIEQLKVGISHAKISKSAVQAFLDTINSYIQHLQDYDPGDQEETLRRIEQIIISFAG